jgi:hypothetical protein
MNRRNFVIGLMALLAVAGLAWLFHTPPPVVKVAAAAAAVTKADAPKTAPTQIAPPVAPPAQNAGEPTADAAPAPDTTEGDPEKELGVAIDDIVDLLQAGDIYTAMMRYVPPDMLAQIPEEEKAMMQSQIQSQMAQPQAQQGIQMFIQVFQSMKTMSPTINGSGNLATYQISDPSGRSAQTHPMSFVKIEGKWYVSPDTMNGM